MINLQTQIPNTLPVAEQNDFQNIVDISPFPILVHKMGKVVYANALTLEMFGFATEQDLLGKNLLELTLVEDRQKVIDAVTKGAKEKTGNAVLVSRMLTNDGKVIHVETKSYTINFKGEECRLAVAYNYDYITQVEKELRDKNIFIEKINQTLPLHVSIFDLPTMKFIYRNYDIATTLGYAEDEVENIMLLAHPAYAEDAMKNLQSFLMLKEGEIKSVLGKYLTKTGEIKHLITRATPFLFDEAGRVQQVLTTTADISDLQNTREQLDEKVKELSQKNEQLEKYITSNTELEKFAYIASHDLREPIRSIVGFTQLLQKRATDKTDPETKEFLGNIIDSAQRMNTLVHGLLDYSRVTSTGKQFEKVDTNELLKKVADDLKATIEENKAEIIFKNLPAVQGDEIQLRQLFQNLISNGIKFRSENKKPRIEITAQTENGKLVFKIQDNGIGLDKKYHEKVFQIFTRLNSTAKYQGSGIGLAVCKKIVERHGGEIWLESELGKGTAFYFTISSAQS